MGLGGLLLNGALAPNCHSTRVKNSEPAASRPAKPLAVGADVAANFDNPGFVILAPALGFPALVNSDGIFSVLLISKQAGLKFDSYVNSLRLLDFDHVAWNIKGLTDPHPELANAKPTTFPGTAVYMNEFSLADYRTRIEGQGFATFDHIHGRLSPGLLSLYEKKGYTTLVVLRLQLNTEARNQAGLFTLRHTGEDEDVREILQGLRAPYEGCPTGNTTKTFARHTWRTGTFTKDKGGLDVIMLHPVQVGVADGFLNLAHITDLHIARRWDFMQEWTFAPKDHLSGGELRRYEDINNANRNYEAIMRQIVELTKENQKKLDYIATLEADLSLGETEEQLIVTKIDYCKERQQIIQEYIAKLESSLGLGEPEDEPTAQEIIKSKKEAVAFQNKIDTLNKDLQKIRGENNKILKNINELKSKLGPQIMIHTGDLIEYCRGYNGTGLGTYDDNTFEYSTNWTLYYQLLAGNYRLPTFTVLGNHDWRMNPYAPSPTLQMWPNFGFVSLSLLTLVVAGLGPGLILWGLQEASGKPTDAADKFFRRPLAAGIVAVITLWLSIAGLLASLGLYTTPVGPTFPSIFSLMYFLGGLILGYIAAMFSLALPENATQILSGLMAGGSIWGIFLLILLANEIWKFMGWKYLKSMVDKKEETVEKFFPKNFRELDLFGDNSLFAVPEESFLWYSLVINPFMDYVFSYGPMQFVFLDWNRSEGLEDPPIAIDAISREQFNLLTKWAARATNADDEEKREARPILSSHFPVFSQDLDKSLKELEDEGLDVHDDDLERGIMDDRRDELMKLLEGIEKKKTPALILGGHTHAYGVFQQKESNIKLVHSEPMKDIKNSEVDIKKGFDQSKSAYVVTVSSGPPGDVGDGTGERKPGYRRIYFDGSGKIRQMIESDADAP